MNIIGILFWLGLGIAIGITIGVVFLV